MLFFSTVADTSEESAVKVLKSCSGGVVTALGTLVYFDMLALDTSTGGGTAGFCRGGAVKLAMVSNEDGRPAWGLDGGDTDADGRFPNCEVGLSLSGGATGRVADCEFKLNVGVVGRLADGLLDWELRLDVVGRVEVLDCDWKIGDVGLVPGGNVVMDEEDVGRIVDCEVDWKVVVGAADDEDGRVAGWVGNVEVVDDDAGRSVLVVPDPTKSPFSKGSLNHCDDGLPVLVGFVSANPAVIDDAVEVIREGTSLETKNVIPDSSSWN